MGKFKKNDQVYVNSLKRFGVVLAEGKAGTFQVSIGSLSVLLKEADLMPLSDASKQAQKEARRIPKREKKAAPSTVKAAERVDLHGMRVEEAMRLAESAIDRAIMADVDKLEIVHGLGTGKIREALHKYLKGLNVVAKFRLDDKNPGVTWVYF